jgi:hypothetical protein
MKSGGNGANFEEKQRAGLSLGFLHRFEAGNIRESESDSNPGLTPACTNGAAHRIPSRPRRGIGQRSSWARQHECDKSKPENMERTLNHANN